MKNPILVWEFEDAPEEYKALSDHGGDEDWLALVPASYKDIWIGWLESETRFGSSRVGVYELPDGSTVHIGAH